LARSGLGVVMAVRCRAAGKGLGHIVANLQRPAWNHSGEKPGYLPHQRGLAILF
jgi:hypothetical protein